MKTIKDLFDELNSNDDLKKALAEAIKSEKVADFLKDNGCDATVEEVEAYLQGLIKDNADISPEDLKKVAGGHDISPNVEESAFLPPWICNSNYSSMIDPNTGKFNPMLICG